MMEMALHPMFVSLMVDSVPAELITADGNVTCALTDSTTTQTVTVYINTIEFTLCNILDELSQPTTQIEYLPLVFFFHF